MELIIPIKQYFQSYLELLSALSEHDLNVGEPHIAILAKENFDLYNERLAKDRLGEDMPKDWVPASLFWGVDNDKVIGRLHLRHELPKNGGGHIGYAVHPSERGKGYATEMLQLGLSKAADIGLKKVYLTCDKTNTASRTVIEKNGGNLENEFFSEEGVARLGFWITI